jgi:hypothetical protein
MSKLIQLKVSEDKLKKYNELVDMLGLNGTYGEYQRAIDFSIDFTIFQLIGQAKTIPGLTSDKLALWYSSLIKLKERNEKAALALELTKKT